MPLAAFALMAAAVSACGDKEKRQAEALYVEAETAAQNGDYRQSVALLNSIDSLYPKQVAIRRKAMHLRAKSGEHITLDEIAANEAERARLTLEGDSLQQLLSKVDHPLEPYYVAKGAKSVVGDNGIEARMAPDGMFYMISSLRSPKVNHTSVTVSDGGASARTAEIAHDGERNDRSMGYEVIHYMMPECDSVGRFIAQHPGALTVTFNGSKSHTMPLKAEQADGIATVWRAAVNVRDRRHNALEHQRLERQLELNRSQAARTYEE